MDQKAKEPSKTSPAEQGRANDEKGASGYYSGEPFLIKIDSTTIQQIIKKPSLRNMDFDAQGLPEWNQNRCQNLSKNNANTGNEQNSLNKNNMFSWMVKSFKFIVKSMFF